MRRATSLAAVFLALVLPARAMSFHTSFEQLISDLETLQAEHAVPGFALTVVSGRHGLQTGAGGVADLDSGRPVTANTLFRIGSITKTFNALAILLLVEQGRLDLDTLMRKIIPDAPLENPWADTHPVRVAQLLGHERLLEATSIARMERPATTLGARHGLTYGCGPGLDQSLRKGFRWYGHGGDGDGYLSHFAYNREADAGYFLTINAFKHDALHAMRDRVQDHLTHALSPPRPPPSGIDPDTLRQLTGTYVAVTRRFAWQAPDRLDEDRLQVVLEDGALYTRSSNGRRLLIPAGAHRFRREGQPLATIAIAAQDGDRYLQAEFGNYRRVGEMP